MKLSIKANGDISVTGVDSTDVCGEALLRDLDKLNRAGPCELAACVKASERANNIPMSQEMARVIIKECVRIEKSVAALNLPVYIGGVPERPDVLRRLIADDYFSMIKGGPATYFRAHIGAPI